MPSHRRVAHAIPPVPVAVVPSGEAADNAPEPAGDVAVAGGRRRTMRNAAAAASASLAGGSAGYAFGGPVLAIFVIVAAGVLGIAAAVVLSAVLSNRDPRSPFERLMLILCVLLSRPPGTYLPQRR
jgi:hypothetical protein